MLAGAFSIVRATASSDAIPAPPAATTEEQQILEDTNTRKAKWQPEPLTSEHIQRNSMIASKKARRVVW